MCPDRSHSLRLLTPCSKSRCSCMWMTVDQWPLSGVDLQRGRWWRAWAPSMHRVCLLLDSQTCFPTYLHSWMSTDVSGRCCCFRSCSRGPLGWSATALKGNRDSTDDELRGSCSSLDRYLECWLGRSSRGSEASMCSCYLEVNRRRRSRCDCWLLSSSHQFICSEITILLKIVVRNERALHLVRWWSLRSSWWCAGSVASEVYWLIEMRPGSRLPSLGWFRMLFWMSAGVERSHSTRRDLWGRTHSGIVQVLGHARCALLSLRAGLWREISPITPVCCSTRRRLPRTPSISSATCSRST